MEEKKIEDGVRTRLILSGIGELCKHGVRDFSLRRVAICAEVSCAAPYRHFKDKDEFILEIIRYVFSKWELLCLEIDRAYHENAEKLVVELALANIGFWTANGNFRSILMLDTEADTIDKIKAEMQRFDAPINSAVDTLARSRLYTEERRERLRFFISSLIYGTVMLFASGKISSVDSALKSCRALILHEIT